VYGPNLEGKEARFGDTSSALAVTVATDTSSGAANVAYDSLMPLATFVTLVNMQIGEVVFGGVGSGLYGMLILAILTVFIAGLMVGRTPEYLGKKIEQREITLVVIASLVPAFTMLIPTAIALLPGLSTVGNAGAHGFSEILYAFASVSANNGSSMGGLVIQTDVYNVMTAIVMLLGRFGTMIVILALAGGLAGKVRNVEATRGQLSTTTPLFGALLTAVALIVTALTFVPSDALGPLAEGLLLQSGRSFSTKPESSMNPSTVQRHQIEFGLQLPQHDVVDLAAVAHLENDRALSGDDRASGFGIARQVLEHR
jgi:K+-transporting ATPase ATPase A chain